MEGSGFSVGINRCYVETRNFTPVKQESPCQIVTFPRPQLL